MKGVLTYGERNSEIHLSYVSTRPEEFQSPSI